MDGLRCGSVKRAGYFSKLLPDPNGIAIRARKRRPKGVRTHPFWAENRPLSGSATLTHRPPSIQPASDARYRASGIQSGPRGW
ncbi:hypothetical protein B0G62_10339 [Paraburkholderia eburnea]|uniref:Uncharacterized protein n=1 Tax=Paraburkholderia eburnea TaxID=1189126 RepID=A0A2S4MFR8_9BURK|nr:hypothetical protein B0G62_10339 [Paraburkholderia eburnea]PRZ25437.1 hypothetical protein BX588_10239 [Paraburkholderia eburnea]